MNGAKDGNGRKQSARGQRAHFVKTAQVISCGATVATCLVLSTDALAGIQFKSYQTHTHVSVSLDPSVNYQVEKIEKNGKIVGLRLILDNVREELESLADQSDTRTDEVKVTRVQSGSKFIYEFQLSDKAQAVGIEYFDYRNKVPAEIALDYWLKNQKPSPDAAVANLPKATNMLAKARAVQKAKTKNEPASLFAGCGQSLSFTVDGGAFWKVYHVPYGYKKFFNLMPADVGYEYPLVKATKGEVLGPRSKEISHYRLAHKLYKEGKYALVLRTIEFFETQYKKSELKGELDFLRTSTLVQLSRLLRTDRYMDQAIEIHKRIVLESPDSERARLSLAFIVQQLMESGTPVFALEYALMGADRKANGNEAAELGRSVFRLASAEALFALGEHDRAERAYQLIIDQNNAISTEAAFRMGEIYSARKFWERAILAYERAIRQFPNEANRFPSAWFNLAEAYFRIDRLADAERVYLEFAQRFPSDSATWATQLRIAELDQMKIKTAEPKRHEAVASLYESVVNRHPYSPGAMMAELRLARCYRDLKPTDGTRQLLETFFGRRELKKFESPLVDMKEIEQWMDLTEARFHVSNANYRAALGRADDYRMKLGKIELSDSFKKVYAEAIVGLATQLANNTNDKGAELLAAVEHYGDFAPKPEPFSYLLSIAKGYQLKSDFKAVDERLLALEKRLSEANNLEKDWFRLLRARQGRALGEKSERIILELSQIRDESPLAAMKYEELGRTATEKGDFKGAVAYDNRLLESDLADKLTIEQRFEVTLRRLENMARFEAPKEIARYSEYALLKFGAQTQFTVMLSRLRDVRARALYDSENFKGAVEAIGEILDAQPNHPRRNEFEFMRGKGLTRLGRDGEAVEAFRKLAQATQNDVWKKSAQAELDQIQWETNVENQLKQTGGL